MKKTILVLLCMLLSLSLFAQGPKESEDVKETVTMNVAALKGPTSMGLVELMKESDEGLNSDGIDYTFTLEGAPDAITPSLVNGKLDVAAIPANLASVIYNNTDGLIKVLGINTLGVLYIAENGESVSSVEDLRGKTIYSAGKGSTPEYALTYILASAGLEIGKDVFIEWRSEHAECLSLMLANEGSVAMLPQPFLTSALKSNPSVRVALDLNDLWEDEVGSMLITGVTVARSAYAEENGEAVDRFLSSYADSVEFVNSNIEDAAKLIGEYGIIAESVALDAIEGCNITLVTGEEMKSALSAYLEILYSQNSKSVGGALPSEDFYY